MSQHKKSTSAGPAFYAYGLRFEKISIFGQKIVNQESLCATNTLGTNQDNKRYIYLATLKKLKSVNKKK